MDVSRVSMVTPKIIDWRKLTAKDIIKYDSEGMNVPAEYLSWAKSFHVDLEKNDTDETTYEMALSKPLVSQKVPQTPDTEARQDSSKKTENDKMQTVIKENTGATATTETKTQETDETEETDAVTNPTTDTEGEEKLTAEEKKKKLEEQDEGLISIGRIFKSDSEEKASASETSASTINTIGESSDNEISSLDTYMNELLSQANSIQSQIKSLQSKNGKNQNNFAKLASLQQELKNLGTTGQNVALGYDNDLNMYTPTIDGGSVTGLDAQDYGDTTVDLGQQIKKYIFTAALGRQIENTGKDAVSSGENVQNISIQVDDKNNANIQSVHQHQSTINEKTGVSAAEVAQDNNNNSLQNENQNPAKREVLAKTNPDTSTKTAAKNADPLKDKQETPAQKLAKEEDNTTDNKKTEVEKKELKIASGNLDEILKRKMRKGEVQEA